MGILGADLDDRSERSVGVLGTDDQRIKRPLGVEPPVRVGRHCEGNRHHVGGGDLDLRTGDTSMLRAGQHDPARERALLGPGHPEVADQLGLILDGDFFILAFGADP